MRATAEGVGGGMIGRCWFALRTDKDNDAGILPDYTADSGMYEIAKQEQRTVGMSVHLGSQWW